LNCRVPRSLRRSARSKLSAAQSTTRFGERCSRSAPISTGSGRDAAHATFDRVRTCKIRALRRLRRTFLKIRLRSLELGHRSRGDDAGSVSLAQPSVDVAEVGSISESAPMRLIEFLTSLLRRPSRPRRLQPPSSPRFREASPAEYGGGYVIGGQPPASQRRPSNQDSRESG